MRQHLIEEQRIRRTLHLAVLFLAISWLLVLYQIGAALHVWSTIYGLPLWVQNGWVILVFSLAAFLTWLIAVLIAVDDDGVISTFGSQLTVGLSFFTLVISFFWLLISNLYQYFQHYYFGFFGA